MTDISEMQKRGLAYAEYLAHSTFGNDWRNLPFTHEFEEELVKPSGWIYVAACCLQFDKLNPSIFDSTKRLCAASIKMLSETEEPQYSRQNSKFGDHAGSFCHSFFARAFNHALLKGESAMSSFPDIPMEKRMAPTYPGYQEWRAELKRKHIWQHETDARKLMKNFAREANESKAPWLSPRILLSAALNHRLGPGDWKELDSLGQEKILSYETERKMCDISIEVNGYFLKSLPFSAWVPPTQHLRGRPKVGLKAKYEIPILDFIGAAIAETLVQRQPWFDLRDTILEMTRILMRSGSLIFNNNEGPQKSQGTDAYGFIDCLKAIREAGMSYGSKASLIPFFGWPNWCTKNWNENPPVFQSQRAREIRRHFLNPVVSI